MSAALPLRLDRLMPTPLLERIHAWQSEVWKQNIAWSSQQRIFIQAPSGTGKTTLIHMLYGLRSDFEGELSWGGLPIDKMNAEAISELRQKEVSVIFQDMRLFPSLTAWENLEIKRVLTGTMSESEVLGMMESLGIADRKDRPASTLSYGEQQRVAIIRGLLQPFKWLLMDEPFSHLDTANTVLAARLIDDMVSRNGASFILADLDDNAYFSYTQKLRL